MRSGTLILKLPEIATHEANADVRQCEYPPATTSTPPGPVSLDQIAEIVSSAAEEDARCARLRVVTAAKTTHIFLLHIYS